ncbi:MAG: transcriptional repressor [Verrucomicrobia bacterium]|nr:transcriptional repressor [Verrucomicrobiota bacterium]MBI3866940.1 transcriptional repressor [Verrucomicrobiota bacterium]
MKPRASGCCHAHDAELPDLTEKLRRNSRKITGPRQAILAAMRNHPRPLLIKEIHGLLGKRDCDLVTVYRSIDLLRRMGMVRRIEFGKGGSRYELIPEGDSEHHHHLVCEACGRVLQIDECLLLDAERIIEKASGFRAVTHRLEFFGLCPDCQG